MLKSLFKDSFIYSISSFLSKGIGFILLPFYTNVLSPSDYGVMDMIAIFIVLVTNISSIQINQAMFRYYASAKSLQKKTAYFSTTFFFYLTIYSIVTLLLLLYNQEVSFFLFGTDSYFNIIILASLNLYISSLYFILVSLYRLNFKAKRFALLSMFNTFFTAIAIVFMVLYYDLGLLGIFLGQLIINIVFLCYVIIKLFHNIRLTLVSFKLLKQMLKFGIPLVPTVLILLAMQYIDRIMITKSIGIDELGLYAVATKISSVIGLILTGFQLAWGPYIFNKYHKPETNKLVSELFYYINIISLILISFLVLFSSNIILFLTNDIFYKAYTIIPILATSTLFFFIGSSFSIGFAIANKNEIQTLIYVFTIGINIFLNYFLINLYGIFGAAVSTMISFFISSILNLYFSNKYYAVSYKINKLSIYIINFIFIAFIYTFLLENDLTIYNIMIKLLLFLISWTLLLILFEKQALFKLLKLRQSRTRLD